MLWFSFVPAAASAGSCTVAGFASSAGRASVEREFVRLENEWALLPLPPGEASSESNYTPT
jgi:hypothetical protein